MIKNQSQDDRPLHQTVAEGFEFKNGAKSIAVKFTEQKLSAHAGSATFRAWLHGTRWGERLAAQLPSVPKDGKPAEPKAGPATPEVLQSEVQAPPELSPFSPRRIKPTIPYYYTSETCFLSKVLLGNATFHN